MSNKKKLTIIGICVGAVILAALLIALIALGGKKRTSIATKGSEKSNESSTENPESSKGTDKATSSQSTTKKTEPATKAPKIKAGYEIANEWQSGDTYFKQYDFWVENLTNEEQKDWEISIKVAKGTQVSSAWNCNCEIKDDVLYINAKTFYGENIEPKAKVEGMGVIISSSSKTPLSGTIENNLGEQQTNATSPTEPSKGTDTTETTKQETTKATLPTVTSKPPVTPVGDTPLARHGKLSVSGTNLVDKNGNNFRLCGVSTHGLQWFPQYVNKEAFQYLRDDWGANVIRLALYVREDGYLQNGKGKDYFKNLIDEGVTYATELGMYVIIDWHVLNYNPNETKNEAIEFFAEMAAKYSSYDNVLYEICNEPTGSPWASQIKPYAEDLVSTIRKYDRDAVILVGTNTWSQDVDEVIGNRLSDDRNVVYVVHFYAATHTDWIRNKVTSAVNSGIPVFISECSICDASGNGGINYGEADKWFNMLESNNISYVCWNLCNKQETSALISSGCSKTSGFTDSELSETGKWFKERIKKDTANQ